MKLWKLFFKCLWQMVLFRGGAKVCFDTEAQCYDCHLVSVDYADWIDYEGQNLFVLDEAGRHRFGHTGGGK